MPKQEGQNTKTSAPNAAQPVIAVFCSAATGNAPSHLAAARILAEAFHGNKIKLVYGGGTTGLMGELSRTLVALSGKNSVTGVIPRDILALERPEAAESGEKGWFSRVARKRGRKCTAGSTSQKNEAALLAESTFGNIVIVPSLSARKQEMVKRVAQGGPGSGFVALSGGFGTADEVMEVVTLHQFGVHKRRVCFYNVNGYWDGALSWMEGAIESGFVRGHMHSVVGESGDAEGVLGWLREGRDKQDEEMKSRDVG